MQKTEMVERKKVKLRFATFPATTSHLHTFYSMQLNLLHTRAPVLYLRRLTKAFNKLALQDV